jgi:hypothetical protein
MRRRLSIKNFTLAVLFIASLNLVWQFYRMRKEAVELHEMAKRGVIWDKFGPSSDEIARFVVELSLIVALIGSGLKGLKSNLVSLIGLSGAAAFYIYWSRDYFWLAEISAPELKYFPHLAYLIGANYLDLFIATSIVFLILLHLRQAVLSVFRPTKPSC